VPAGDRGGGEGARGAGRMEFGDADGGGDDCCVAGTVCDFVLVSFRSDPACFSLRW
jgi:hypothetical protein